MDSKLSLSLFEMDLLNDREWILTKNLIIKKAQRLLEEVQNNILGHSRSRADVFPPEVRSIAPKISKGENYQGLPWLMLDYPRYFNKPHGSDRQAEIFAIRILFWWGNFFSITLHLAGPYKQAYRNGILDSYDELCKGAFYYCIHEDQWHHHFEKENYLPVKTFGRDEFSRETQKKSFIKLSSKIEFSEWSRAIDLLTENFVRITQWLG